MTVLFPKIAAVLPGVHRVSKQLASGGVAAYWYAWRGGPRILSVQAKSDALLDREVANALPVAIQKYQELRRPAGDRATLHGLVTRYLDSPDFARLGDRTRKDRRKFLDKVRQAHGKMELKALASPRTRPHFIAWRDEFAGTPKTADELLNALSTVLQWAVDRGELQANPVRNFPRIYEVDRAHQIWEQHHLDTLLPHCAVELAWAVHLALLTGLRLGDLIKLSWTAMDEQVLKWQTSKSRKRRTVVVPLTPDSRALLKGIPKRATTILTSSKGKPWTVSGIESALRRAKLDAQEAAREKSGPNAEAGIHHLRFHDFRGTAVTRFVRQGYSLDEVAQFVGWSTKEVAEIARRYVTQEELVRAMTRRVDQNASGTLSVNRAVN